MQNIPLTDMGVNGCQYWYRRDMEMTTMDLGRFLKRERARRKWTQVQLAERSGVPQPTISDIERGANKLPGADYRRRLADALGVSHLDLLVAAGELRPDEIPEPGILREPFPEGDVRREIVAVLEALPDEHDQRMLLEISKTIQRGGNEAPEYPSMEGES